MMGEPSTALSAGTTSYAIAPNLRALAADDMQYAYRDVGEPVGRALVLLQHFRGNLDNWDPALIDALAQHRRVITVDYRGVGASTGRPADTIEQMAGDVLAFTDAMELPTFDLLGFSIGSFVAQRVALTRPDAVG
jgi:pimeloyl-ACP methyl ester carboxylesterase